MSLTVDLIRHAESDMNVAMANAEVPFIGGRQNEIGLSELGEVQAVDLGYFALANGIHPTEFYCSPAIRTRRTHELSAAVMGRAVDPTIDDRLQELDQGTWTNQPRTLYDDPTNKRVMRRLGSDFAPPGGESMNDVARRAADFLSTLITPTAVEEPRHIWVHTHGVIIKSHVGKLLGWTHEQTYKAHIGNASLTRLTYDGAWRVAFVDQPTGRNILRA